MRLAFVSTIGFPWGGSEVLWTATAKLAIQNGHEVLVSIFDWPEQHEMIKELECLGAKMVYRRPFFPGVLSRLRKKGLNLLLPKGRKATYHDYLKHFNPDHIHFSLAGGDEIVSDTDLLQFVKQTSIPFSLFFHSYNCNHAFNYFEVFWFRQMIGKSRNCFFTSKAQLKYFKDIVGNIGNMEVLHHPLNEIRAVPIELGEEVNFGMIGSLICKWKGQDKVLRILGSSKWRERRWRLHICGEGRDKSLLMEIAREQGIEHKVIFHGHKGNINEVLGECHLIIIPSVQDSGPIVLFETMLAERPIVGTPVGAMLEYVKNCETGILAESPSLDDLSIALDKAWLGRDVWWRWGMNGRNLILKYYDFASDATLLNRLTNV